MKYSQLKNLTIGLLTAGLFVGVPCMNASAKGSNHAKSAKMKTGSKEKAAKMAREVSGTVLSKKTVRLPEEKLQNVVVMLKTNKGSDRLLVDLGNQTALREMNIDKNSEIQVEGRMAQVGRHQILVARQFKANGKVIQVDRSAEKRAAEKSMKNGEG